MIEEKIKYYTYNSSYLCGMLNKVNNNDSIVIICHARTSSKDSRPTTKLANMFTYKKYDFDLN